MLDKKQLEAMYQHNLKVKKVLFIISLCLFAASTIFLTTFLILYFNGYDVMLIPEFLTTEVTLRAVLVDLFESSLAGGLVTMLFSFLIFGRRAAVAKSMLENFDQIYQEQSKDWNTKPSGTPIVDVKPMPEEKPKGKYDDLIKEYTKLYEQGVITKEDLENKKKELGYQ